MAKSVESLGVRTRVMDRKLREVEKLPDATTQILLGAEAAALEVTDEGDELDELTPATAANGP